MKTIVSFGEIMGRFCPENFQRFRQSMPGRQYLTFAGAEANVAASLSMLGGKARFVTALPDNEITQACLDNLGGIGVDISGIRLTDYGRMGLYFVEKGANQRPSKVVYDREYSAVSLTEGNSYDWDSIFEDAGWLHCTGITPALSKTAAEAAEIAMKEAKRLNIKVSCDLNFRKKLWRWEEGTPANQLAKRIMTGLLPFVDVLIANEEDAAYVLGIHAAKTDVEKGQLNVEEYETVATKITGQYPNISTVAITLRESVSATHNNWGAMLYDATTKRSYLAPVRDGAYMPYEIRAIVDRVGGGDSFGAGLIFAMNTPELTDPEKALQFAVAASCLCHSIEGDFNYVTRNEVESLMGGSASGRVVR